jgi:hypothetical protein
MARDFIIPDGYQYDLSPILVQAGTWVQVAPARNNTLVIIGEPMDSETLKQMIAEVMR